MTLTTSDAPHTAAALAYAQQVVAGEIAACQWVRLACERQLNDLEREDFPYRFDVEKAERVCRFIELLPHIKGKWAGTRIKLEPWQQFILTTTFGWVDSEGYRRFRTAYTEVPRKNAKSTLSSGVGLYMLTADGEGGAEVYSAATTRDQARIVFRDAQQMARRSPGLKARFGLEVNAHNVNVLETASKFEALSAEGNSLDGLNIHAAIVDELHAHKTREVWDVLETATGARTQSLMWAITTAGSNRAGICYELRTYLTKVLQGVAEDETFFGMIYTIDDGDDWTDPAAWAKANPNYGVSVLPDDIARLAKKAMEMPSAQNNFLTKRLNVWVNAETAWMDMRAWDRCGDNALTLDDFEGEPCWVGVDLASKTDIAAMSVVFERGGEYYVFGKYYLPEQAAEDGRNSQYGGWVIEGRLIATPGNVTDYAYIEDDLRDLLQRFDVQEVAYDSWNATQFATRMMEEGAPMVEIRQNARNLSEPMKQLEALALQGKLHHDACPVLAWMVSNVVCEPDRNDNIFPRKERPENKIDGVVAALMALGRAMVGGGGEEANPYETRGIRTL